MYNSKLGDVLRKEAKSLTPFQSFNTDQIHILIKTLPETDKELVENREFEVSE